MPNASSPSPAPPAASSIGNSKLSVFSIARPSNTTNAPTPVDAIRVRIAIAALVAPTAAAFNPTPAALPATPTAPTAGAAVVAAVLTPTKPAIIVTRPLFVAGLFSAVTAATLRAKNPPAAIATAETNCNISPSATVAALTTPKINEPTLLPSDISLILFASIVTRSSNTPNPASTVSSPAKEASNASKAD